MSLKQQAVKTYSTLNNACQLSKNVKDNDDDYKLMCSVT